MSRILRPLNPRYRILASLSQAEADRLNRLLRPNETPYAFVKAVVMAEIERRECEGKTTH